MNPYQDIPTGEQALEVARKAALEAGAVLLAGLDQPKDIRFKGDIDLVTKFDLASEEVIVGHIRRAFPDHRIVAEEGGEITGASECRWYIDPLDGTVNYAHQIPVFAVSIGFEAPGPDGPEIKAGVVYDPVRDELFHAVRGQGAFVGEKKLSVSLTDDMDRAFLATGFPYDVHERAQGLLERFGRVIKVAQGVRRAGAAAIDLSWVAAGRFDGFWEEGLKPWDTAAGVLLVEEAGGKVTDFSGGPIRPTSQEVLATNGCLHYTVRNILGWTAPDHNFGDRNHAHGGSE